MSLKKLYTQLCWFANDKRIEVSKKKHLKENLKSIEFCKKKRYEEKISTIIYMYF